MKTDFFNTAVVEAIADLENKIASKEFSQHIGIVEVQISTSDAISIGAARRLSIARVEIDKDNCIRSTSFLENVDPNLICVKQDNSTYYFTGDAVEFVRSYTFKN